ncbi:Asp-tRNA(Asn)/Glu-tRNA(Gln) amidotransferase subunit GatA [Kamptonema cortianum]|nr:Asp-tRNA(Asn)/Glu-tRNA(Gln) amidotransferase subunit GatA [Geitlerinema splendidum]MDK3160953.1 Asp-tRNA(Asn)/Glu-tRNA(Gln) amidotransferase subunit GatA [Kamptonema cortianum]
MLTQLTATELASLLSSREVSAREIAEAHLDRIEKEDSHYGAYLHVSRDEALASADVAQKLFDEGRAQPLTGVPIAVKDNISTAGIPTTCASKILEGYVPPYDATVIENMKSAGMIILGKTNLDEFAMGTSCENSAFQATRNPWDTELVPGGSSGGSAAAVSAELATVSLGSDTGGSIRQPASLCGLVGFKPTYGRVSRYGLVAFGSSLDQIGPFARSVEDAALVAELLSGHDPLDSTSLPESKISTRDLKQGTLKGLKIAVPKQLMTEAIEPGVREVIEICLENLRREGAITTEVDLPSIDYGVTTYYIIAPAEASSNLAKFDGVRFGPRVEGKGHIESFSATRGQLFGPEVKLRIMVGTYALSAGYYDAYYHRAQQVRALMVSEFEAVYRDFDVIASPTSPSVAFPIGGIQDQMALKLLDLCTIPANMGGFPSISVPCGLSNDLPVGLLLTGPVNGDEKLLQQAYAVEQGLGRDYRRPPIL